MTSGAPGRKPLLFTVPGAARVAQCKPGDIKRAILAGQLQAVEIKPQIWRVSPAALAAWKRAGKRTTPASGPLDSPRVGYIVRVTLRAFLDRHGLTAYRVVAEGRGVVGRNAVYAMARGDVDRIDLGTLSKLAGLLEHLTGKRVAVGDLLTFDRTSQSQEVPQ